MNADVLHFLNTARQLHDIEHAGQVPDFEDCHAWKCRRSRAAAERLDNRIFTPPNTRLTEDLMLDSAKPPLVLHDPKWRMPKMMS